MVRAMLKVRWLKTFGALTGVAVGKALAYDGAGRLALAGEMRGAIDFGDDPLVSFGADAACLAVFDVATGEAQFSRVLTSHGTGAVGDASASAVGFGEDGAVTIVGRAAAAPVWQARGATTHAVAMSEVALPAPLEQAAARVKSLFATTFSRDGACVAASRVSEAARNESLAEPVADALDAGLFVGGLPTAVRGFLERLSSDDTLTAFVAHADESATVAGYFVSENLAGLGVGAKGAVDLFVARLAATGEVVWHATLGGVEAWTHAHALAVLDDGRVLVGGKFEGELLVGGEGRSVSSQGQTDGLLALFDGEGGGLIAVETFGGVNHDAVLAMARVGANAVALTGSFAGEVVFFASDDTAAHSDNPNDNPNGKLNGNPKDNQANVTIASDGYADLFIGVVEVL